jgi:signal transduction histidine kinase
VNTLRAKIAVLLVVAIVSVVGLLTAVILYFLAPPGPQHTIEPVAQTIELLARLAQQDAPAVPLSAHPAQGKVNTGMTVWLRTALAERGIAMDATVSRDGPEQQLIVSVPIGTRGWLLTPIPDLPPRDGGWHVLIAWLALITFGATAIAANRMVQPLVLLESAVASVGPDATLPILPEQGPAEVRATAKALNSLSSRLKMAMESRMRLVAAAGHDLRTPITRLRLRAEFVDNEEERSLWLRDLDELERIADSAILLVREESEKAPPQNIALDELVAEVAAELKLQNFDIEVAGLWPVTVRTGRLALSRALRNLLINAATHGHKAHVVVEKGAGTSARITITDEGPGIPDELLGQVFEPFFRADPARRQSIPGAGLGLTIAREIIQRTGGDIKITNGDERGLTQIIELPIAV